MYLFYRIRFLIKELPWKLRRNWQRFRRGWAYSDVWDIDYWFMEMLEPMLRHLKEHHYRGSLRRRRNEIQRNLRDDAGEQRKVLRDVFT